MPNMNWKPVCPACGRTDHTNSKVWVKRSGRTSRPGNPKATATYLGIECECGEKILDGLDV